MSEPKLPGLTSAPESRFGHSAGPGGTEIAWASGRVDASTTPDFEAALHEAVATGATRIVVDLSAVTYISSSGLKALISAWRACRARKGTLALAGLGPRLLEIFTMVGFTQLFPLYNTIADALAAEDRTSIDRTER